MKKTKEDSFICILSGVYSNIESVLTFPEGKIIEIDMGCGKGSFSTKLAKKYPGRHIFSADVMIGRLRKLVKRNQRENVENIDALRVDARQLLGYMLPDSSIGRIHMLCPDPWPKDRHKGKRLLCSDFLSKIYRVLADGGVFHFASDDINYFEGVQEVFSGAWGFERDDSAIEDISDVKSDFELRWLEDGRKVNHIAWRKKETPFSSVGH
jgi:tRNA (guanine-N7-)-methyltransferase